MIPLAMVASLFVLVPYAAHYVFRIHYYSNSDPTYTYLLNGLEILHGVSPGHIDHPGTPLQLFIAASLWLTNIGSSVREITDAVMGDPEGHLRRVNMVFSCLSAASALLLGHVAYSRTRSLLLAVFLQAAPLSLPLVFRQVAYLFGFSESFFLMVGYCLVAACIHYVSGRDSTRDRTVKMLLIGGLCGFAMANKVTAVVWVFACLSFVGSFRELRLFVLAILLSFIVSTIPIAAEYPTILKWFWNSLTGEALFGYASDGPRLGMSFLMHEGTTYLAHAPLPLLILGASAASLFLSRRQWSRNPHSRHLLALMISNVVGIFFIVKGLGEARYGYAMYVLYPWQAYVIHKNIAPLLERSPRGEGGFTVTEYAMAVVFFTWSEWTNYQEAVDRREQAMRQIVLENVVRERYTNRTLIFLSTTPHRPMMHPYADIQAVSRIYVRDRLYSKYHENIRTLNLRTRKYFDEYTVELKEKLARGDAIFLITNATDFGDIDKGVPFQDLLDRLGVERKHVEDVAGTFFIYRIQMRRGSGFRVEAGVGRSDVRPDGAGQ